MQNSEKWENQDPVRDLEGFDLEVPDWIDQDISPADIAAIVQGGCSSGAYMPAVTYSEANKTMGDYGDEVLQFIEDYSDMPEIPRGESWTGIAVLFLSYAVELWASMANDALDQWEAPEEESAA